MKIGWKIRKLWHFEVSQIFKKHFLTSRYEYANEWGDDVIASQFSIHFVHRNDKNFIFQQWECYTCLNSSLNRWGIMLTPIYLDMRDIPSLGKISKFSKFYTVQNIWQVVKWWHQLTHLHIHIDWSRNVLWKFAKLQSVITSLFFNRFSSGFHCYVFKNLLFLLRLS